MMMINLEVRRPLLFVRRLDGRLPSADERRQLVARGREDRGRDDVIARAQMIQNGDDDQRSSDGSEHTNESQPLADKIILFIRTIRVQCTIKVYNC